MKASSRLLTVFLVLALVFSFSACSNETDTEAREDYRYYDLIVCMDRSNIRNAYRITEGDPEGKISLLLDYTDRAGEEVADPWYTGDFSATWQDVTEGCAGLIDKTIRQERP